MDEPRIGELVAQPPAVAAPPPEAEPESRHAAWAALQVMLEERAWFRTLDDVTLFRIAYSAPPGAPEYGYATTELDRRRGRFGDASDTGGNGWSMRVS
jgi:hypothetical protein